MNIYKGKKYRQDLFTYSCICTYCLQWHCSHRQGGRWA